MIRGSCLCGDVRFEITAEPTAVGMCHCSKCRKVSGTGSNAVLMVGLEGLRWAQGEEAISKFALPDGWGVARCTRCGSPAPTMHPGGGAWWVPAGLLDDDPGVGVGMHIHVDSKAPWETIPGDAPRLREGLGSEPAD